MSFTGETPVADHSAAGDLFAMADVMLWGDGAAATEMRIWRGRRLTLYRHRGEGLSLRRDNHHLSDEFSSNLALGFMHDGAMISASDGETVTQRPGDVSSFRMDRPLEARMESGSYLTYVHVPLRFLESRGIDTRQLNAQGWPACAMCRAIIDLATRIFDEATDEEALVLETGLAEILVGVLALHDSDPHAEDVTQKTRLRATQLIEENYTDVDLDADRIAAALGISRRYLYGLFEGRGASIATMIRDRRAAHAEWLLVNEPSFSIRRIAYLSGFGSEDRLFRTFKQITGESPSSYRRRHTTYDVAAQVRESGYANTLPVTQSPVLPAAQPAAQTAAVPMAQTAAEPLAHVMSADPSFSFGP